MEEFYRHKIERELGRWQMKLLKQPGFLEKHSKQLQNKINAKIPRKVQDGVTAAIKGIFQSVLFSLKLLPKDPPLHNLTLAERDNLAKECLGRYQKIAAAEGAGMGAGGFIAGLADFPALIAIKLKFLFELAHIYGFSAKEYNERVYILLIFQLAFSSQEKRHEVLDTILHWDEKSIHFPSPLETMNEENTTVHINWEQLQMEYRDAIDFRKTLQLLPGIGAAVGAWANYGLLDDLGETGMNCYRLRILRSEE